MDALNHTRRLRWLAPVLAVSLCVNLGFIGAIVTRHARVPSAPSTSHAPSASQAPIAAEEMDGDPARPDLVRRLNLDAEQRARMTTMKQTLMTSTSALLRESLQERKRLMTLLKAPQIDEAAVQDSLERIRAIQARTQQAVVAHILAERRLLHPEQVGAFNALVLPRAFGILASSPSPKSAGQSHVHAGEDTPGGPVRPDDTK
jgi:Spy/CpxP family protein refolding chaperone